MAEPTPELEALSQKLQSSDEHLAAFKEDPEPLLSEHGVSVSSEELTNLKAHLARHDTDALKATLAAPMHAMFSQRS